MQLILLQMFIQHWLIILIFQRAYNTDWSFPASPAPTCFDSQMNQTLNEWALSVSADLSSVINYEDGQLGSPGFHLLFVKGIHNLNPRKKTSVNFCVRQCRFLRRYKLAHAHLCLTGFASNCISIVSCATIEWLCYFLSTTYFFHVHLTAVYINIFCSRVQACRDVMVCQSRSDKRKCSKRIGIKKALQNLLPNLRCIW